MSNTLVNKITDVARRFLVPTNPSHRRYEALRAFFVEGLASAEVARRFGYTPGSFRVLCHAFRRDPAREFFLPSAQGRPENGPRPGAGGGLAQAEPLDV